MRGYYVRRNMLRNRSRSDVHVSGISFRLVGIALVLAMAGLVVAQTESAARPQFEVASIRPTKVDPRNPHRQSGCSSGMFVVSDLPVKMIIGWAYEIKTQFSVPDWAASSTETYNVEAKADKSVSLAQCKQMAQSLLEDRFKLKLHRENKEMPVYFLVPANSGPKLHEVGVDSPADGDGIRIQGHKIGANGWDMSIIAANLGSLEAVGRPVVDKTGYKGLFTFSLEYSTNKPGDDRPDIFTAVQQQLGLRLESGKAPVEFVVIDHLERPSEN